MPNKRVGGKKLPKQSKPTKSENKIGEYVMLYILYIKQNIYI